MRPAISYQLLTLTAVAFITLFAGWGLSSTSVFTWTSAVAQAPTNISWD
jgi:hypothetical protein